MIVSGSRRWAPEITIERIICCAGAGGGVASSCSASSASVATPSSASASCANAIAGTPARIEPHISAAAKCEFAIVLAVRLISRPFSYTAPRPDRPLVAGCLNTAAGGPPCALCVETDQAKSGRFSRVSPPFPALTAKNRQRGDVVDRDEQHKCDDKSHPRAERPLLTPGADRLPTDRFGRVESQVPAVERGNWQQVNECQVN